MGDSIGLPNFRDTPADAEAPCFPVAVDEDGVVPDVSPTASYIVCSPERRNIPPPTRLGLPAVRASFTAVNEGFSEACSGRSGDAFARLESCLFSLDCLECGATRETDPGWRIFAEGSTTVMGTRRRFVGPEAL